MGCGCADRMRKYVLPKVGYTKKGDLWIHPTRDPIHESEVESHHSRLTLEIMQKVGKERAARLAKRLKGNL